jgi:hypothetical protein
MLVNLTKAEMSACEQNAALRWQIARLSGVKDQQKAPQDNVDLLGIKAEVAVSKVLQLPYSPAALGIDSGADLWAGDWSIDVKASFHESGRLLFKSLESFRADMAILVTATDDPASMLIIGGISQRRFVEDAKNVDLGHGMCWIVEPHNLTRIEKIWLSITERRLALI